MGGNLLMNGVLQLAVYPLLNRRMGSAPLGDLLFIMGIVAILCPTAGQSLNTSRLVVRREMDVTNGDYDRMLLFFGGIGSVIALILARTSIKSMPGAVFTVILIMTTIFRYYGDVEYRLSLHYRKYFIYYSVLTAGYLIGFGLYMLTDIWYLIFVTGEVTALAYVSLTGSIFRDFLKKSPYFRIAFKRGGFLLFSYLITNLTLNIDRLVLKFLIDNTAVTQYYVVSLIGKTMVLLVAPVNTIVISYLTRRKEDLNRKQFMKFAGLGLAAAAVFLVFAQIATPVFIRLFYSDLYAGVKPLITIVNISQILGLLSAYLFIVVLTFTGEKWQLILQIMHLVIISALVMTVGGRGIQSFAIAVLIANTIRVAVVILLGMVKAGK